MQWQWVGDRPKKLPFLCEKHTETTIQFCENVDKVKEEEEKVSISI